MWARTAVLGLLLIPVMAAEPSSAVENQFLSIPSAQGAREHLRFLTASPHLAGSAYDRVTAEYMFDKFREYGLEARIEPIPSLLSFPGAQRPWLKILSERTNATQATLFEAALSEDVLDADPTSDTWLRNHTFLGFSPSGSVTAPVVYANYGRPEDFEVLEKQGIRVNGSIVLTRYGRCFRGLKVMNAEARGAVGTLIYSDPAEDGYLAGRTYPEGPWRSSSAVQRGSAQFLSLCPGDPSRAAASRSVEEICGYSTEDVIPRCPVLPLSYADAAPLLQALKGPVAPESFRGGLNLTYRLGPTEDGVYASFGTHTELMRKPIWNVIAKIEAGDSSAEPQAVVLGNHRDGHCYGAADPNSGTAVLLEIARSYGRLLATGWRPQRTIYLCSWDGEELALIGSTAWGERNARWLSAQAVAYLNCDTAVTGPYFKAGATASLTSLIRAVADKVISPESQKPISASWDGQTEMLGSGSDYTVFLDNLGIPSTDIATSIDPTEQYGVYHSVYDSYAWMETFGDPDFKRHRMMSQVWGLMGLRLADALVLPFNHTVEGEALAGYVDTLAALINGTAAQHELDVESLRSAASLYQEAAAQVEAEILRSRTLERTPDQADLAVYLRDLNNRLAFTERRFLHQAGLPRRRFFKSIKQAPGLYLGYDAEAFPGVTQAINDGEWSLAQTQLQLAARKVTEAARFLSHGLDQITTIVS